ncbi:MAG: hypothetical protein JGK24_23830 [Microcoleus sp. PH2017_29_MFU_D_A]|uniref:hypothetical protein n=1 Tax=unclassified Microcoleus TaxID=2642155 RepID=UPI001D9FAA48|nr:MULTISPECIES: hypothetical protein [unclassified Microcoleus]MCC3417881.1 hypothetical protein [Microcoleus sp. PH2017_07_MST_O_A]MCC3430325.1 hypothetical protein [Microcoleus sp. PH2017_04_SCI_O_A]MCC3507877.1 hypothetical protein [Microcoleus sp. PH2017_17_BER_D_A]MCC3426441.1 hypothetical protein [Microcoleus sp. PH2017_01_SCD_O_A]MCC3448399.1 hypothetical protein [Microcoleus sp. PH2017_09_SFU_O_A]
MPRSVFTLLAALQRQNPRFHPVMTGPFGSLVICWQLQANVVSFLRSFPTIVADPG